MLLPSLYLKEGRRAFNDYCTGNKEEESGWHAIDEPTAALYNDQGDSNNKFHHTIHSAYSSISTCHCFQHWIIELSYSDLDAVGLESWMVQLTVDIVKGRGCSRHS